MNKLEFELWLVAEMDMEYSEYQRLSNTEKSRIRNEYQEYLSE